MVGALEVEASLYQHASFVEKFRIILNRKGLPIDEKTRLQHPTNQL